MVNQEYYALIHYEHGSYGVSFPDFPGCITAAEEPVEAYKLAKEVLQLHISGMIEDNETLPVPSTLEDVGAIRIKAAWTVVAVSVCI